MQIYESDQQTEVQSNILQRPMSRRGLLGGAAKLATGVAAGALVGCGGDDVESPTQIPQSPTSEPSLTPTIEPPTSTIEATSTNSPVPEATASPEIDLPDLIRPWADEAGVNFGTQAAMQNTTEWAFQNYGTPDLREQISTHFNTVTLGDMYHTWLEPQKGQYNWEWADNMVKFAKDSNLGIIGHPLVWGTSQKYRPLEWGNFGREQVLAGFKDHIREAVAHFPDIKTWTLNEMFHSFEGGPPDFWEQQIGSDYPLVAARAIREVDPEIKIIVNDYGNEVVNPVSDANLELVQRLINDGEQGHNVAMGFQMHLKGDALPDWEKVFENLKRFADLKLKNGNSVEVLATEVDIDMSRVEGIQEERMRIQAEAYKKLFETFRRAGAKTFVVWGNNDETSWLTHLEPPYGGPNAEGTILDKDGNPKQSYTAILDSLKSEVKAESSDTTPKTS